MKKDAADRSGRAATTRSIDITTGSIFKVPRDSFLSGEGSAPANEKSANVWAAAFGLGIVPIVMADDKNGQGQSSGSAGPYSARQLSPHFKSIAFFGGAGPQVPCSGSLTVVFDDESAAETTAGKAAMGVAGLGALGVAGTALRRRKG